MTSDSYTVERLIVPASESDIRSLAELLMDAVESGAAITFLSSLSRDTAEAWWRQTISSADNRAVVLVVRDQRGIVGTVQMHSAPAVNQPHRAEITKLIVHRRKRGQGVGRKLMQSVEAVARESGFTLLTLDTKRGDAAEKLYRQLGWTEVGTIPQYALDPDGTPHDAVFFYKRI